MANIFVVGDGAIGLLYSHYLSQQHRVTLLTKHAIDEPRFYQQAKAPKQAINCQLTNLTQLSEHGQVDVVIFTVKAYQVATAFRQLKPFLSAQCQLILSHNGMGNVDEINSELTKQQGLYFLTTRLAGYKDRPFSVLHTGIGSSILGDCNQQAKTQLAEVKNLLNAIPELTTTNNIQQLRFEKLLVNIAINPLSALHNVKNGALTAPQFSGIILNILNEACTVANKLGINVRLAEALANAYQVMSDTKNNYSSMHQDVAHNRITEIDAMCGYICQKGNQLGINTPHNQSLLDAIRHKKSAI